MICFLWVGKMAGGGTSGINGERRLMARRFVHRKIREILTDCQVRRIS